MELVGVVGCDLMGSGIAEVCARAGLDVVREIDRAAAGRGRQRLESSLAHAMSRGKLAPEAVSEALERVAFTTDFGDLADRELVVEAVVEAEEEKTKVFAVLGAVIEDQDAVLASNTS
jgi:3-hydroxybutyryl-CoA dehydrogenase